MTSVVNQAMIFAQIAKTKTRLVLLASFLFIGGLLTGCGQADSPRESVKLSGPTMGTSYHITLVAEAGESFGFEQAELQKTIDDELEIINQVMSTYIDDSELMQFNRAPVDEWVQLSEPLMEVLNIGEDVSQRSEGAFDVTVGPLVNLWGFGPEMRPEVVPTDDQLAEALALTGHDKLQLDVTRARRTAPIFVDLSAVGKGYGVDWIAKVLHGRGFKNFMVEIGGEVRVAGVSPRGAPWRIAVEQPSALGGSARLAIELDNKSVATSGDYRNYYEVDGTRYSHTIDPATGRPITHNLASVTVIADTAAHADAWATALNVLGPEKGLALANAEQLAVYMIVKENDGFTDLRSVTFSQYAP